MSTNKYLIIATACLAAGAAAWYLSRDTNEVSFDSKKHTVEKLRKIVREIYVEGAIHYSNQVKKLRNLVKFNKDDLSEIIQNAKF